MDLDEGQSERGAHSSQDSAQDQALWHRVLAALAHSVDSKDLATWLKPLACKSHGDIMWLGAPNRFVAERVQKDFLPHLLDALSKHSDGRITDVKITIDDLGGLQERAAKQDAPQRSTTRGRSSESVVEQAQLQLFNLERRGQFAAYPISPNNEFPTLLTRLPLFKPGRAAGQSELLDRDHALPFSTSWGEGRKFGPPLTVYDEDTLMALGRLRQNMLIGLPSNMPHPVANMYRSDDQDDVRVHVVYCMLGDIQDMCGTSKGGRNNRLRLDSIRRLAATKIEFSRQTQEKIKSGTTIDLIHVKWDEYQDNAVLYIQFSPIMATWLESAYTYIDWNIRKQMRSDVGKAVHRFLSAQPKRYQIFTKKLQTTIGHQKSYKVFMHQLRETLRQLSELGWLESWAIEGNGRKQPHKLTISR